MRIVWSQLFSKPNLMTLPWMAISGKEGADALFSDPFGSKTSTHFISETC